MKRFAISLPDAQADAVEQIRRKERIPRSQVIQRALAAYLAEREHYRAVRAYEEGYRRHPEDPAEAEAMMQLMAGVLTPENWE